MDVKWIKLDIGIFDNDKIKVILDREDGYLNFAIWINILILAGKCNADGDLVIASECPHTVATISSSTGISEEHIRTALNLFLKFKMLVLNDNIYSVSNWGVYQNTMGLDRIREQNRIRQQRRRDRQKEEREAAKKAELSVAEIKAEPPKLVAVEKKKESRIPDSLNTQRFLEAWERWKSYRKEIKKKLAPSTEDSQLRKLSQYDSETAILMIEQSIGEGWQGLFELKDKGRQKQTSSAEDYDAEIKRIYG